MSAPTTTVVALPGLHGSAALFADFVAQRPTNVAVKTIALPAQPASYAELAELVAPSLPTTSSPSACVLVAESFSGPLAVRLAVAHPFAALVLCATFVLPPVPRAARLMPWRALFSVQPPLFALSTMLTGGDRDLARAVRGAIAEVPPLVLADRVERVATVDVTRELAAIRCPVLYLQATNDRLVRGHNLVAAKRARPTLTSTGIAAPHLLLQTSPTACWDAIAAFLRDHGLSDDSGRS